MTRLDHLETIERQMLDNSMENAFCEVESLGRMCAELFLAAEQISSANEGFNDLDELEVALLLRRAASIQAGFESFVREVTKVRELVEEPEPRATFEAATAGIDHPEGVTLNIDFDGTCVSHEFPYVGREIGAAPVLRELVEAGHKLILFTMRSDTEKGDFLSQAVAWFASHSIPLYGINTNPTQHNWTSSPKSYALKMIDDSAVCAPLTYDLQVSKRPFIDWVRMRELLVDHGILAPTEADEREAVERR